MSKHWTDKLVELHACREAVEWAKGYPSLRAAWKACKRGDWMLWLIGLTEPSAPWSEERGVLVRIAVEGAMLAPPCPDEYEVSRQWCIDALLRWYDGEDNRDEVVASRDAAAASAADAYAAIYDAAAAAAYAAIYAADAVSAYSAIFAACASGDAIYAAYFAFAPHVIVSGTAWRKVRMKVWVRAAQIVRRHHPKPPRLES